MHLHLVHWRHKNKRRNKGKIKSSYFTVKTALTLEQEVKQAQAHRSKLFRFLAPTFVLTSAFFLVKTGHVDEARGKNVLKLYFFLSTNQSTRSKLVRGLTKMADAEQSFEES